MAYSGEMQWRTRAGDEIAARLGEPLTKDLTAQALRTALDPDGLVDPVGAGGRRHAALRGAPARAGRRRPGDRHRPGLRPRLRQAAAARSPARRRPSCSPTRRPASKKIADVHRRRRALDGRGPDGLRGRRRAAARGRRLRHHDLDAAVLRPGRRPLRARPEPRRDRVGVPAVGADAARLRLRDGGRSATTCSAAGSTTRATSSPPRTSCSPRPTPARAPPTSWSCRSRRSAREARFDRVLFDGGEFGHAGEVHVGSEEEMDFLGIPGLLEPDQMRELLQPAAERARREAEARGPPASRTRSPR